MKLATLIVTRSKSCHVRTLHTLLRLNMKCYEKGFMNTINYVNDDPFEKATVIQSLLKDYERILFIDFAVSMDDGSINQVFEPMDKCGVLVFPGVKEGIDWDMFKEKVKKDSEEPLDQMALYFDTDVSKSVTDDIYFVKKTSARCWIMNCNNVVRHIKDKKTGLYKIKADNMFDKLMAESVTIFAYIASKLTMSYTHECVGNILHSSGVKVN